MKALVLLKKDVRMVLRNKRELLWLIVVPLLLLGANFFLLDQNLEVRVALAGDGSLLPTLEAGLQEAKAGGISLQIWPLSEQEAARRLEKGSIHAYLAVSANRAVIYANSAETEGAVAQAIFSEVVRDSNQTLAVAKLAEIMDDPAAILESIDLQVVEVSQEVSTMGQLVYSSLFVIMGVITALSLGQQNISMERNNNTLVSLRKSPLSDKQIVWAKVGAALFSALLPIIGIVVVASFILPMDFALDPWFYLIILVISFNSVALGLLVGSYVRGANEGSGIRFLLTLPAMFLAAVPVELPLWLDSIAGVTPTLISAQIVRSYFSFNRVPPRGPMMFLVVTGIFSIHLASTFLGREE